MLFCAKVSGLFVILSGGKMKKTLVVMLCSLAASGVWAEESPSRGLMVGAGVGIDTGNFADELEDELGSGFNVDDDGANTGADLYVGFAFGGASSVRLGYRKFGEQAGEVSFGGAKIGEYEVDADGLYLAADLMFPVADAVYLGGTLGLQRWDGESTTRTASGTSRASSEGSDFFYGVRGKFLFNQGKAGVVAGYTLYRFEDERGDELEYDSISLGLEGYFR